MVRKISNIVQNMCTKVRYVREQKMINNYVSIHQQNIDSSTLKQLKTAQKTMANYASSKNVSVDIYDARTAIANGESNKSHRLEIFADKLLVKVTNRSNNSTAEELVSANIFKIHNNVKEHYFMINIPSEDLQYTRLAKKENEDTFLRNVYRNIQNLTEKILK